MPYIKPKTDALRRVLNTYELNNGPALASVLGVSRSTALNRIKHPEDLTVDELRRISLRGHVPVDELRAAL